MKIAIDTQLLMRTHARRMLFGAAELASADIVVPETAAFFAKLHYHKVASRYVEKRVEWDAAVKGEDVDEETLARRASILLHTTTTGFTQWLDSEPLRNDSLMRTASRTPQATVIAMQLKLAGVVVDSKDHRWIVGEDPYVVAEALEAGAHWLASENFATLREGAMERWLDEMQSKGKYGWVPRPFILKPDDALATLLAQAGLAESATRRKRSAVGLAYALSEPKRAEVPLERRLNIIATFGEDARDGGLHEAGVEIDRWYTRQIARLSEEAGRAHEVTAEMQRLRTEIGATRVQRTRDAEDRRLRLETRSEASGNAQTTQPQRTAGRGR